MKLSYKERRNYLIELFTRSQMFNVDEGKTLVYVDGIGYAYENNKLVIRHIRVEAVHNGGVLDIDTAFDAIDCAIQDKVKRILIHVNLGVVSKLPSHFFENCKQLKSIRATKIRTVPEYCFFGCEKLDEVYMPQLIKVGSAGFGNCKLSKFVYKRFSYIGTFAFQNTSLTELKCDNIELFTYSLSGLYNLESLKANQISLNDVFYDLPSLKYLDIGNVIVTKNYFDFTNNVDVIINRLSVLGLSKDGIKSYLKEDKKLYSKFVSNEALYKVKDITYKYTYMDMMFMFKCIGSLSEFHYRYDNKPGYSQEEKACLDKRFKLIETLLSGVRVIRDV
jgi:hypothetical protein